MHDLEVILTFELPTSLPATYQDNKERMEVSPLTFAYPWMFPAGGSCRGRGNTCCEHYPVSPAAVSPTGTPPPPNHYQGQKKKTSAPGV